MRKKILIVLLFTFVILTGCGKEIESEKPKFAATILPLYDALSEIGQDKIEAVLIVPPGASPHTFTVTPAEIKSLQGVKAIFENNFGLEEWIGKLASNVTEAKVINVSESFKQTVENHNGNPHLWLNPDFFVQQARVIADTLKESDPQNAGFYEANFNGYSSNIVDEASKLKESLKSVPNKNIISFHDAFPYFAEYFGLAIIGTVEQIPGHEPTPKEIANLENTIRDKNIKVIFNEPQMSKDLVNALIEDTGVKVLTLDPLGDGETRTTYIGLMDYNIQEILTGLK